MAAMKIAIFHFGFFYSGGGEKLVLEEVSGLKAMGHDVTCFAPYVDRERCFPAHPEISRVVTLLPPPPQWLPFSHAIWVLLCCVLIPLMAFRFRSYDVFLGANQPAPWMAFVLSKILAKPYAVYLAQPLRLLHPRRIDLENGLRIRDGDQEFVSFLTDFAGRFIGWADSTSVRNADALLVNGHHVRRWIGRIYGRQATYCPAGCYPQENLPPQLNRRSAGQLALSSTVVNKPYILLTNRHSPMKRFEYALWSLKAILREIDEINLVITGQETEYTSQLRSLTDSLRLTDRVSFVGLVSETELAALYRGACLYVYTSPEEDFGMGVIEAMAAGVPVVAWRAGGPMETVKDGVTGFLASPYDTDDITEKMLTILRHSDLAERMGRRAAHRARHKYSYDKHNITLLEALTEIVAEKSTRYSANAEQEAVARGRQPVEVAAQRQDYVSSSEKS